MRAGLQRLFTSACLICLKASLLIVPQMSMASQEVLSQAKELLLRKEFKQATELLLRSENKLAGNLDFDYMLGTAALDAGLADTATVALERVLALRPEFMGARLDLARAYFLLGDIDRAKQEFETVARNNPPPAAKATLEAYLKRIVAIQEEANRPYRFFIEYSFGRDSNINFSSSSPEISIPVFGGVVFTLDPSNVATARNVNQLTGGVEYDRKIAPDFGITANYAYRYRDNWNSSSFDSANQDLSAGFYRGLPTNRVSLSIEGGRSHLDSTLNRTSSGLSADWKYALGPRNQITTFAKKGRTRFVGDLKINDFDSTVSGINSLFILAEGTGVINAALLYGEEDDINGRADGEKFFHGLRLMGLYKMSANWDAGLTGGWTRSRYQKENVSFLRTRADTVRDQSVFASYRLDPKSSFNFTISRTDSDSNIALYEVNRTEYSLKFRRSF